MEFRRLRAGLRRLSGRKAFSLLETMIAFALIGITALITASGIIAGLGIYNSANELRNECEAASSKLYMAAENGEIPALFDPEAPQVGVITHTGDFSPERSGENVIDVYAVCAVRNEYFGKNSGIVLYYYEAADSV